MLPDDNDIVEISSAPKRAYNARCNGTKQHILSSVIDASFVSSQILTCAQKPLRTASLPSPKDRLIPMNVRCFQWRYWTRRVLQLEPSQERLDVLKNYSVLGYTLVFELEWFKRFKNKTRVGCKYNGQSYRDSKRVCLSAVLLDSVAFYCAWVLLPFNILLWWCKVNTGNVVICGLYVLNN